MDTSDMAKSYVHYGAVLAKHEANKIKVDFHQFQLIPLLDQ